MKNFFTWDFSFLTLEPSILAFAKKPIFSGQVLDRQVQGRKIPIFVYVRYFTNFSRAIFFVFCKPLNSQQGLDEPPPENKWAFRTYVYWPEPHNYCHFSSKIKGKALLETWIYCILGPI